MDIAQIDGVVEQIREIWEGCGPSHLELKGTQQSASTKIAEAAPTLTDWEENLTHAVWKADPEMHPWKNDQPGVELYANLARSFRGSMLARVLPRSVRYILLRDGKKFEAALAVFFKDISPKLYAPLEAVAFADWISKNGEADGLLLSLLEYDLALLRIVRTGEAQIVRFPGDPSSVFEALAEARLPKMPAPPAWEFEILPDGFSVDDFSTNVLGS